MATEQSCPIENDAKAVTDQSPAVRRMPALVKKSV